MVFTPRIGAVRAACIPAFVLATALSACGESKTATQVAARVNDREITVHQLNDALGAVDSRDAAQVKKVSAQALERLIDQELLVQKALAAKLDRDPRIVSAMESARRQVLARAYLESIMSTVPAPSKDEVAKFKDDHPELFRDRRLYQLQELQIKASAEQRKQIAVKIDAKTSTADLVAWMKASNIMFTANEGVRAPESVPLALAPRLAGMNDGDTLQLESPAGLTVLHLVKSERAPIADAPAAAAVEKYLRNIHGKEAAESELKDLRSKARVEYVGDFARGPSSIQDDNSLSLSAPAATGGNALAPPAQPVGAQQ
jgi:EpsD family peptidyl-prolyl cis-trans isomerase